MKIKIGDRIYLQKYDVNMLFNKLGDCPQEMLFEAHCSFEPVTPRTPTDAHRFCFEFAWPENLEWIEDQDWILDYDEYDALTSDKIEELAEQIREELDVKIRCFKCRRPEYRNKHFADFDAECIRMRHRLRSLEVILDHKRNHAKFEFPEKHPKFQPKLEETKPKGIFARIFRHS